MSDVEHVLRRAGAVAVVEAANAVPVACPCNLASEAGCTPEREAEPTLTQLRADVDRALSVTCVPTSRCVVEARFTRREADGDDVVATSFSSRGGASVL